MGEAAASSPDASREDGWRRSMGIEVGMVEFRFRFPEPEDDGDDIRMGLVVTQCKASQRKAQSRNSEEYTRVLDVMMEFAQVAQFS